MGWLVFVAAVLGAGASGWAVLELVRVRRQDRAQRVERASEAEELEPMGSAPSEAAQRAHRDAKAAREAQWLEEAGLGPAEELAARWAALGTDEVELAAIEAEELEVRRQYFEEHELEEHEARAIAGQWHGGQWSALYSFSSTGAVRPEVLEEVRADMRTADGQQYRHELAALERYLEARLEAQREAVRADAVRVLYRYAQLVAGNRETSAGGHDTYRAVTEEGAGGELYWEIRDTAREVLGRPVEEGSELEEELETGLEQYLEALRTVLEAERVRWPATVRADALEVLRSSLLGGAAMLEGSERGKAAASWVELDSEEAARTLLEGLEAGDPETSDALPQLDLSGQWADGPTVPAVVADALGRMDWAGTAAQWYRTCLEADSEEDREAAGWLEEEVLEHLEAAFSEAAAHEVERVARTFLPSDAAEEVRGWAGGASDGSELLPCVYVRADVTRYGPAGAGADALHTVCLAVADALEEGRLDGIGGAAEEPSDVAHEVADSAVPTYTRDLFEALLELGAYREELEDWAPSEGQCLEDLARVAVYAPLHRLAASLLEYATEGR